MSSKADNVSPEPHQPGSARDIDEQRSEVADPAAATVAATEITEPSPGPAQHSAERRRFALNTAAGGIANAVKIGIQLVMLPLMAHLLGPAEFGLYALALPTVAFFMALADGGLGAAMAREKTRSSVIWSTAFWLLMGVGILLALGVSFGGLLVAGLAKEPKVRDLMVVLSVSFVFITASVLPSARLTQEGRLVVFNAADLAGTIVGACVAIALATAGAGAMSLAVQYVTVFSIRAVILNSAAFVKPTFEFRLGSLKDHISTGTALMGSRLCDFCGRLAENLIYSRTFGPSSLGTYTFANQAPRFLCEAASGPIWGALYAQALREDASVVAVLHMKMVRFLAMALFPMAFLLSAAAPEILGLLLGPKWAEASILLRIVIPFYAFGAVAALSGALLLAQGSGWLLFRLTAALTLGRVAVVGIAPWTDPVTVAWGIGLVQGLVGIPMLCAPSWLRRAKAAPTLRGILSPLLAAAAAGSACYALIHYAPPLMPKLGASAIGWVAIGLIGGVGTYVILLVVLEGRRLRGDFSAVTRLVRRRSRGNLVHAA